jgi:hypothetical protein
MYCSGNASHFFMSQPSYIPKEYLQIYENSLTYGWISEE